MWKLPVLESRPSVSKSVDTDLVLIFQDSGKKPTPPSGPYSKLVERFRDGDTFQARLGQTQFLRFGGKAPAENLLLVGFGAEQELTEEKARVAGGNAWAKLSAEKSRSVVVHSGSLDGSASSLLLRAFAEGLILGCYKFDKYKSQPEGKKTKGEEYQGPERITFLCDDKATQAELAGHLEQVEAEAEVINIVRDWSNEPANIGTPEYFAGEAVRLARQHGIKATVMTERDCEKEGMGLFLGVGQGSEREGRMVILEYTPKGAKGARTVSFVGKGVTFDSGGISIKPSLKMEAMKHDMTGAATVFGATLLAARWGVKNKIVTVLAFTENMPSGTAIVPSSVLRGRSGKTVEVWNTDAEGRLILGDALDIAQDYKPDALIDAATLTGAVIVALGKQCCGVMGNDDELIDSLREAGNKVGERMWQLPCWDEYFDDLKSEIADMKNVANDPMGGTIRGAVFLKQFIRKGVRWAHLDIAAMADGVTHLSYLPKKGASGLYVRTLARFASDF